MHTKIYLTVTRSGVSKMTKEKPALAKGQRAVRLEINVPERAFEEPQVLDAVLTVAPSALAYPDPEPVNVEVWSEP